MRFQSKVVIVTGGASGIGEATVRLFAQEGAKVVIADFSDRGQTLSDQLRQDGYEALFVKTDVTKESEVIRMVEQTVSHYERIDVLFANAGVAKDAPADVLELDNWQRTIDINLTGVFCAIST